MTAMPPASERDDRPDAEVRRWMSALSDGDASTLPRAVDAWRENAAAREAWHVYHVIGDVMRSEELAPRASEDQEFLTRLRARLAAEPVPLAPAPLAARAGNGGGLRRLGWRAPAAVAAGFAVVTVTALLMQPNSNPRATAPSLAAASAGGAPTVPVRNVGAASRLDGRMIRSAELDAYLRAHQAVRGGAPVASPGGGVRSVEMLLPPPLLAPAAQPGAGR